MKDGFIKVCTATPDIRVADCVYNGEHIIGCIKEAAGEKAKVIVLPELCVTGYTCGELFSQTTLLKSAREQLLRIARATAELDILSIVGAPLVINQMLYNCAVLLYRGDVLGIVPKSSLPNYGEFYEQRHFTAGKKGVDLILFEGEYVPFGTDILVKDEIMTDFILAVEICEDLWTVTPPSNAHALAGATVIANLSASNEVIAKAAYREELVKGQSARLFCAYLYADAGEGESTTDLVFAGDNLIAEDGTVLARSKRFENQNIYAQIDVEKLAAERKRTNTYETDGGIDYAVVNTAFVMEELPLTRKVSRLPFVPESGQGGEELLEEVLQIQAMGLKKRLAHTQAKAAVIGVSGGLDSTLALLVAVRAYDLLGWDRKGILAVTMPCFGTTARTKQNAVNFADSLGVAFQEVDITDSVRRHFADIGQPEDRYDVTFENAQARERTQVLMDIANKAGGLVIGTGDLSELALGWATYNGDHMSMYAVNAGVPKTLIRYLVAYEAERTENEVLEATLRDILDTPVSPELLPPKDGEISQKTEHIVGPYALHDFFLYYMVRWGFAPGKILRLAERAFEEEYDRAFVLEWLKVFYRRFFSQQFKRSCMPDGPKVGTVGLSPRGDWRMPSDACVRVWMEELKTL